MRCWIRTTAFLKNLNSNRAINGKRSTGSFCRKAVALQIFATVQDSVDVVQNMAQRWASQPKMATLADNGYGVARQDWYLSLTPPFIRCLLLIFAKILTKLRLVVTQPWYGVKRMRYMMAQETFEMCLLSRWDFSDFQIFGPYKSVASEVYFSLNVL